MKKNKTNTQQQKKKQLDEINKFCVRFTLPKLIQEQRENMNSPTALKFNLKFKKKPPQK